MNPRKIGPADWPLAIRRALAHFGWSVVYRLRDRSSMPPEARFTRVYEMAEWSGLTNAYPKSGAGSTLQATAAIRAQTVDAIQSLFPASPLLRIVDAPCGDMTWMPELLKSLAADFAGIDYLGIDVVAALIEANTHLSPPASNIRMRFVRGDVTREAIPRCDLFFCKDLVNHLSNRDIFRLLMRLNDSDCAYAMITSNAGHANVELKLTSPGASRPVDLRSPPFSLPPPDMDHGYLSFWKLPFAVGEETQRRWLAGAEIF